LKTLEEPPAGVIFVFCTTEPQKLPDTILSRCQRFDFTTIETENISERLQQIAQAEGFEVTPDAVELVARRAGGSMRDSQSLFDQLLAFGGERIEASDVHRLLGTADDERLVEIANSLVNRDQKAVLESVESAMTSGVQLTEFVDQLLNYLRDLMVLAAGANEVPLLSVSSSYREQLQTQAKGWGLRTILAALQILAETKTKMFRASHARSLVELALIRVTTLGELEQLNEVIQAVVCVNASGRGQNVFFLLGGASWFGNARCVFCYTNLQVHPQFEEGVAFHIALPNQQMSPVLIPERTPYKKECLISMGNLQNLSAANACLIGTRQIFAVVLEKRLPFERVSRVDRNQKLNRRRSEKHAEGSRTSQDICVSRLAVSIRRIDGVRSQVPAALR